MTFSNRSFTTPLQVSYDRQPAQPMGVHPDEIWERLAAHDQAPLSLFTDLFTAVDDHLALPTPGRPVR